MADVAVTVYTIEHLLRIAGMGVDTINDLLVAADTVFLQHNGISRFYHDRLVKILQRKTLRVMITVFRLRHIFADQIVRCVAIVAGRHSVVRTFLPAVILLTHDVAVDAGLRIVRKIRKTLPVIKSITTHTGKKPERRSQDQAEDDACFDDRGRHRIIDSQTDCARHGNNILFNRRLIRVKISGECDGKCGSSLFPMGNRQVEVSALK